MTIFAVFIRGSSNARNFVDNCIWVGEADSAAAAKKAAKVDVNVYNGQYLEAFEPREFSDDDQELIRRWTPMPRGW